MMKRDKMDEWMYKDDIFVNSDLHYTMYKKHVGSISAQA